MILPVSFRDVPETFGARMVDDGTVLHCHFVDVEATVPVMFGTYVSVTTVVHEGDTYDGSYDVTPDWDGQTLPTSLRFCSDDIDVRPIPVASVSNVSGGRTVTVGG